MFLTLALVVLQGHVRKQQKHKKKDAAMPGEGIAAFATLSF